MSSDLALYYDFDDIASNVVLDKGRNASQNNGDVGANVTIVAGVFGDAVECPGNAVADGNYVSIDDTPGATVGGPVADTIFTGDFSISVWMNFPEEADPPAGVRTMGSINWTAASPEVRNGFGLIRKGGSAGDLARVYAAGAQKTNFTESQPLLLRDYGNWHMFTWTFQNGGPAVWYRDGVEVSSGTMTSYGVIGDTRPFFLGSTPGDSPVPDHVKFDDFAIWHRALSADEVAYIYAGAMESTPKSLGDLLAQPEMLSANTEFEGQTIDRVYTQVLNVTLGNGGESDLVINSLNIDKGGHLSDVVILDTSGLTFPLTIANGEEVQVTVNWKPANSIGERLFALTANSNDPLNTGVSLRAVVVPHITDDLAVYYDFDDIQNNVVTDMGGNALQSNGDVGANVIINVPGVVGNAVELPGNTVADGNFISIDDTPGATLGGPVADTIFTGDFTVSAWFNFPAEADPAAGARTMGSIKWTATSPDVRDGFGLIRKGGTAGDLMRVHNSEGVFMTSFPESAPLLLRDYGNWHMQTWTFKKNGEAIWYRDGVVVATGVCRDFEAIGASEPWVIGASPNDPPVPDRFLMDEFAIWHRALDKVEVAKIFKQGQIGEALGSVTVPVEVSAFNIE